MKQTRQINEDFAFLLRKMITINKLNKSYVENTPILLELNSIYEKIYESDFSKLFEMAEYIIINLTIIDPKETINYINKLVEKETFPQFFNHIFFYYLSVCIL